MELDRRGYDFAPPEVMNYAQLNPAGPRLGTVREKKSASQIGRPRPAPPPIPGTPGGTGGAEGGAASSSRSVPVKAANLGNLPPPPKLSPMNVGGAAASSTAVPVKALPAGLPPAPLGPPPSPPCPPIAGEKVWSGGAG
eukprot:1524563-Heterocapsa_arctica.AAC.1